MLNTSAIFVSKNQTQKKKCEQSNKIAQIMQLRTKKTMQSAKNKINFPIQKIKTQT